MKKETTALAKALENLIVAVLAEAKPVSTEVPAAPVAGQVYNTKDVPLAKPAPAPTVPPQAATPAPVAAPPEAPVVSAPVAAPAPAPAAPSGLAIPVGSGSHDEIRAHLLPVIQSNQGAMTAVHGVLTGQFAVNELTSLPVASIPAFETAVNVALAALPTD